MRTSAQGRTALAALTAILAITASWWALALWPVGDAAPEWFRRTRDVCFGTRGNSLPNAGGWLLLIGQPAGMVALLFAVWGSDVRRGFALATARFTGQVVVGAVMALTVVGLAGTVARVRGADAEPFSTGASSELAAALTRVNDAAPALSLIDQSGQVVTIEAFRGRPVLVSFAFAHCETMCPLTVSDVLTATRALGDHSPVVLLITLDPWRDTPSRLPSIATQWGVDDDARVLSGDPDVVERVLNAWRVPRVRNQKTGDLSHPALVYVIGANGRITYVVNGGSETIVAAVRAL